MKEELQGKLVEILSALQSAAGKAGDFATAQLPDIAQQYIVYGRFQATATLVAYVLLLCLSLGISLKFGYLSAGKDHDGWWTNSRFFAAAFGTLASIFCLLGVFGWANSAFLVWFAPKVWLIKEIATLIK